MAAELEIRAEATPNPNSLKFSTNRTVWEGRAQTFSDPVQAFAAPLARDLLGIPGVKSVFLLRDFVTVSRKPEANWGLIAARVDEVLREHLGGQE